MRIRGFSKTYDGRTVLQMPELELEAGRVYAVVGANGSGKSTLAKVLAGVETADDGLPVLPAQTVGYMPQKLHVDPTLPLSVLRFLRLVPGVDRARAQAALKEVGAEHVQHGIGLAGRRREDGVELDRVEQYEGAEQPQR